MSLRPFFFFFECFCVMNEHFFTNKFGTPKNVAMTVIFSIIKKVLIIIMREILQNVTESLEIGIKSKTVEID